MTRRNFIEYATGIVVVGGISCYLMSDRSDFIRSDIKNEKESFPMHDDEREILTLASLSPSGHNTQPWFVKYHGPFQWAVCSDRSRWLPEVDPAQRETMLSLGTFLQNLAYAANNLGYSVKVDILAKSNQDEEVFDIELSKSGSVTHYDVKKILERRTIRSGFIDKNIRKVDLHMILENETEFSNYFPNTSKENIFLNTQTIVANKIQSYRDAAQRELSNWVRFSNENAQIHRDGLTTASMEILGLPGWIVRNFYDKKSVMTKDFRDQSISKVEDQVARSGGCLILSSPDNSVGSLLESGRRLQRIWLRVKERNIAIHPMSQILEEEATRQIVQERMGSTGTIQFVIRIGYVENYPEPVSLRRSTDQFVTDDIRPSNVPS